MSTSINKSFLKRLLAQRDEAKLLGLTKIAAQLSDQIAMSAVREDYDSYKYDLSDLKTDVQNSFWDAALRTQDFYNKLADSREIQEIIEKTAEEFINSIRVQTGSLVGAYETKNPGEEDVLEVFEE